MYLQERSDKNFKMLMDEVEKGLVIPFVGAGMSVITKNIYPTWKNFLEDNAKTCMESEEVQALIDDNKYEEAASKIAEDNIQFGQQIINEFGQPYSGSIDAAAVSLLPYIFEDSLVITTNFDYLLEKSVYTDTNAFQDSFDFQSHSMMNNVMITQKHFLMRLHGKANDLSHIIFTKKQYDYYYGNDGKIDYAKELPKTIKRILENKRLLFLGCSLHEDRITQILKDCHEEDKKLNSDFASRYHYAIMNQPETKTETIKQEKELNSYGILPVWYPHNQYSMIKEYLEQMVKKKSKDHVTTQNLPRRNPYFTGRGLLIEDIFKHFNQKEYYFSTQIVSGLGGIGKTQVVAEYAYQKSAEYDVIWWVNAETRTTMFESYVLFCIKVGGINENQVKEEEFVLQYVHQWLIHHKKWLLIFDNVDREDELDEYFPKDNKGNILITTRNKSLNMGRSIYLENWDEKTACEFLIRRTQRKNIADAAELGKRLGYLPLALEQAAAYIVETGIDYTGYLRLLKKYGTELFNKNTTIKDYKLPVTVTWNISLKKITSESARQFIFLCAYMAPDSIEVDFFRNALNCLPEPLKEDIADELQWNDVVVQLLKYSLVNGDSYSISIHNLVQEIIRNKLQTHKEYIVCCLNVIKETFEYTYEAMESPNYFKEIHAHSLTVADYANDILFSDEEKKLIADVYMISGRCFTFIASYGQAMLSYQKALAIRETILGKEHPSTATTYSNIAGVYESQGDYAKALEWYQKAMVINILRKEYLSTAITYNNIAGVFESQGGYAKALKWYKKALIINEGLLGKEHLSTAKIYNNIAGVYLSQGGYAKALEWYQKALVINEATQGKEHPETATIYNNIAGVYESQGDYAKALEWLQKALVINEAILGKEHLSTALTYNNIGGIYLSQGDYAKALEWLQKALVINEVILGKEHPEIAKTYNHIAGVYLSQGTYAKGLECYQKALVINEEVLGKEHPETATTYNYIAGVYMRQGEYTKALECYQKALVIREEVLGKEHPETATTYLNIARLYESQGEYAKALEWYQKGLVIIEELLGKEHPSTATIYNNIAGVYESQGDYAKGLECYQKALVINEAVLGKEHLTTGKIYNNIAVLYESQEDYAKALECYQKALVINEAILGKEHPSTATTYHNIAGVYKRQGTYVKALECYQKALVIREEVLGKEHPSTATTYHNIAWVYESLGEYAKALECYQKALAIMEEVLGKEHPETATTYNNIAGVYLRQGEYTKAQEWFQKALVINEEVLGKEHPSTAMTYNNIAGVYDNQRDYAKAQEWYQKALVIIEEVLGKERPETATIYNNIAGVYERQGDYAKAQEWYQKALVINETVLGKEHPSTAITYNNIARVYSGQGEYVKALECYQKAFEIFMNKLGRNHPYTKMVAKAIDHYKKKEE